MIEQRKILNVFEALFFCFIAALFLTLGADFQEQYFVRLFFGIFLICLFVISLRDLLAFPVRRSKALLFFAIFIAFEVLRWIWALLLLGFQIKISSGVGLELQRYLSSSFIWFFDLAFIILSFSWFDDRPSVRRLLMVMSWSGFIIAVNAIPPLLRSGAAHLGYKGFDGQLGFFLPIFYLSDWAPKYFISRFAAEDWVGDMMAFGFFAALGITFYCFSILKKERKGSKNKVFSKRFQGVKKLFVLHLSFALTIALAILLLFTRGTTLSFLMSTLLFLLFFILKFPSQRRLKLVTGIFIAVVAFLLFAWALRGSFPEANFAVHEEAAKRAMAIYRTHSFWGVGTEGYSAVAKFYATDKKLVDNPQMNFADFQAMNHYLQLLAEEGKGAYAYFLFVLAYFYEIARGLLRTKSRFKFTMTLALASAVLMIFTHAAGHHLMARFPVFMLVYISMGVSLRIIRPSFHNTVD